MKRRATAKILSRKKTETENPSLSLREKYYSAVIFFLLEFLPFVFYAEFYFPDALQTPVVVVVVVAAAAVVVRGIVRCHLALVQR